MNKKQKSDGMNGLDTMSAWLPYDDYVPPEVCLVAVCQCGNVVGSICDTEYLQKEIDALTCEWQAHGCAIEYRNRKIAIKQLRICPCQRKYHKDKIVKWDKVLLHG